MMVGEPYFAPRETDRWAEHGLSARVLLSSIRRHPLLISLLALLAAAAGAFVGLGLPAWFQAESVLIIHARPQRIAEFQELPDPVPDLPVMRSEVDVLQSRSVIEPVVRSLKLWQIPEFQQREYPSGWSWQNFERRFRDIWSIFAGPGEGRTMPEINDDPSADNHNNTDAPTQALPTQALVYQTVEKYGGYLSVANDGKSMTIRVTYRAWNPERAAMIVNAHLESYQNLQEAAKLKAAERTNSALNAQIAELRGQLKAAENAVTNYREEHHLTGAAKDSGALSGQLASLNSQLIAARADLAENEARAARIGASAAGKAGADTVPEVIASGTITMLRGQEAQLSQREADLSKDHGDAYPELRRVRASLQNLRDQIGREIGRSHAAALQLVERSRTRERSIQQSIMDLTRQVNLSDAGLQQLQGNAESIRLVLRDFEKRAQETAASPALLTSNSSIVSRANPAATSTSPKAATLAGAGGFVGFTMGSLLALFLELRDRTFRTSTQVEQEIGSLKVSATPRASWDGRKSPADMILSDHHSMFAEAFRVSWANIQLAGDGPGAASLPGRRPGMVLGITSASTGEGKSTHALAFSRTVALAGEKVVLVDADLRRSGVSRLIPQSFCFTLRDFIEGRCTASEVVAVEERSGVHFVPSRPVQTPWTSQDLRRFTNFIDHLKQEFDVVIIDLPPILGLAETIRLSIATDEVALIIRWGRTERQLVQFALDTLRGAGVNPSTAILNDIDLRAQQRRGYRDRTIAYSDEGLYRPRLPSREAHSQAELPSMTAAPNASSKDPEQTLSAGTKQERAAPLTNHAAPSDNSSSDIRRLYDKYLG
jgi:succinoglycan biosynthesis transport protein ExoP